MKHNKMMVWEVSGKYWDSLDNAPEGNIVITEKRDGWYMMATSANNLDDTIKAIMQAMEDEGIKHFSGQMAMWLEELHNGHAEDFRWTESGYDDCLRGKWLKSWEIEYNDDNNWTIFLAVAK